MTDGWPPVMLLVTVDDESRAVLDGELRRRYGTDYEVITCRGYDHARAVLDGLRRWERDVAMVFSCYSPADRQGLAFLRRARSIHPSAKRAVVVNWGDFESSGPIFRAIAEGHAESQLVRPERRRDEEFHGSIIDLLDDWHLAQGRGFEAVRLIGRHDERTHTLRDAFARNEHVDDGRRAFVRRGPRRRPPPCRRRSAPARSRQGHPTRAGRRPPCRRPATPAADGSPIAPRPQSTSPQSTSPAPGGWFA
jgi:hypothetical protein